MEFETILGILAQQDTGWIWKGALLGIMMVLLRYLVFKLRQQRSSRRQEQDEDS